MPVAAQTAPPKPDRDSKCIGERNWGLVYLAARAVLLAFLAASCALRPLGQTATPRVSLRMSTTFTSKIIPSWRRTRIRRSSYSDSLAGFDYSLNTSSFLPDFESANELRVCAARSRRRNSVGRTRGVGWRLTLWRFYQGRSAGGLIVAAQPGRPARCDCSIAVRSGSFKTIENVVWSKVWAIGCGADRGSPWRAEARSGKTRRGRCRRLKLLIMAPWPGAVSAV